MTPVMVRYRVKPDRVAENERYIKKVFKQLDDERIFQVALVHGRR